MARDGGKYQTNDIWQLKRTVAEKYAKKFGVGDVRLCLAVRILEVDTRSPRAKRVIFAFLNINQQAENSVKVLLRRL